MSTNKLPINEEHGIYTYADLAYMNAIVGSKELLRLRILNETLGKWCFTSTENITLHGEYVDILNNSNGENTIGSIWRECKSSDILIINIDYNRVAANPSYISLFIKNETDASAFDVTNYEFRIDDKKYRYENNYSKKLSWYKLIKKNKQLSFHASTDGKIWESIHSKNCEWISEESTHQLGVFFSLGNYHYQYNNWKNMNYVQLFLDIDNYYGGRWIDYFMFTRKGYDHIYGAFSHFVDTEYHDYEEVSEIYGSISNFVRYSIKQNDYILLRLDEYYVPERWAYKKMHYEHDNLIYGYDNDYFYILGFTDKMISSNLPLDLLDIAARYRTKQIIRHRLRTNDLKLNFDINSLLTSLYEYINGVNSSIKYAHILAKRQGVYGLHVLQLLLSNGRAQKLLLSDKRITYILYEHSKLMIERLHFLNDRKYISDADYEELLVKGNELAEISCTLVGMHIKYHLRKRGEEKIYNRLALLYQKQKIFYNDLYDILNENIDADEKGKFPSMLNESSTAIITYIDENYDENLLEDFLSTLKSEALYKGKIVIIDYGMSKKIKEKISEAYDVNIYEFEKTMPVFSLRYKHIPDVIKDLPAEITNVMLIDGGDVWFQKPISPIFELTKERIGCVEESIIYGKNEWTLECVNNLDEKITAKVMGYINERHVKNSGMVCGPRNEILYLTRKIYNDMKESGIEFFGIDQIFFNYELNRLKNNQVIILDNEFNYVLVTNKNKFVIDNGKIYDNNLRLLTVVHNAGGAWKVLDRDYNKTIEENQYIAGNVRKFD